MTLDPVKRLVLHDVFELQLDPENPRLPETMKSRSQASLLQNRFHRAGDSRKE